MVYQVISVKSLMLRKIRTCDEAASQYYHIKVFMHSVNKNIKTNYFIFSQIMENLHHNLF